MSRDVTPVVILTYQGVCACARASSIMRADLAWSIRCRLRQRGADAARSHRQMQSLPPDILLRYRTTPSNAFLLGCRRRIFLPVHCSHNSQHTNPLNSFQVCDHILLFIHSPSNSTNNTPFKNPQSPFLQPQNPLNILIPLPIIPSNQRLPYHRSIRHTASFKPPPSHSRKLRIRHILKPLSRFEHLDRRIGTRVGE